MTTPVIHPAELHLTCELIHCALLMLDQGKEQHAREIFHSICESLTSMRDRTIQCQTNSTSSSTQPSTQPTS